MTAYVPARGDYVWLEVTPQDGYQPARRQPALVLSPQAYNAKTNLMLVCPVAAQPAGYPFEVEVSAPDLSGVIITDQVRSVSWPRQRAQFISRCKPLTLTSVTEKLLLLLEA